jgi:hypothetical protein
MVVDATRWLVFRLRNDDGVGGRITITSPLDAATTVTVSLQPACSSVRGFVNHRSANGSSLNGGTST